ncbi:hypothetical protein FHS59_002940 [Algoriphagus iocasae]|uniref:DUF4296 domain-containing protein n=1 Tax=Algoriphagus iocasae TaxID=1836499 RepID=A0A841MP66_9BACT|nr:DUF4296 domain-containing protein [Algoriphagus iocasae]MBB6327297.1 hypothetical protein [Algoriphagus iocasae]
MNRLLIICASIFLLSGCKENNKPEGLLDEEKMVEVLIDIQLTEGITSAIPVSYDSSQVLYKLLEKEVFAKHQVDDSVFTESLRYYLQFPGVMDEMYSRILDSLAAKETSGIQKDQGEIF